MKRKNSIAIFLAATSALAISTTDNFSKAGENDLGGLKEWNTDMPLEADFILDDEAQNWPMKQPLQVCVYLLEKVKIVGNKSYFY